MEDPTYKMKSDNGQTISSARRDLAVILEQFNIQINNPCAVLMQDTARRFLNTSKPKDKYSFFLKATQLEQMRLDFDDVNENIKTMDVRITRKAKLLPEMKGQLAELQQQYNDMQKVKKLGR